MHGYWRDSPEPRKPSKQAGGSSFAMIKYSRKAFAAIDLCRKHSLRLRLKKKMKTYDSSQNSIRKKTGTRDSDCGSSSSRKSEGTSHRLMIAHNWQRTSKASKLETRLALTHPIRVRYFLEEVICTAGSNSHGWSPFIQSRRFISRRSWNLKPDQLEAHFISMRNNQTRIIPWQKRLKTQDRQTLTQESRV